jgi:hypothetical protein
LSRSGSSCLGTPTSSASFDLGHPALVADALMLATAPFSRDGRSRCRVARFSRLDLPDANVPDVTDTVATAGGLVLPRSPFWQSVNRPEVTLPASLQVEAPPEDTIRSSPERGIT